MLSGNVILLKHSEVSPEMGKLIEQLFSELFPQPLLKHHLLGHELTDPILADVRVRGASITGSTVAGLKIASIASRYLKKYVLELGGSDPYLIFPDADLNAAAKMMAQSRLQNTGQSCIAGKRCLVHEKIKDEMLDRLKKEFASYQFGLPYETGAQLGPLADHRFKKSLKEQIEKMQSQLMEINPDLNRKVNPKQLQDLKSEKENTQEELKQAKEEMIKAKKEMEEARKELEKAKSEIKIRKT